jgi:hypothetical protein
MGFVMVLCEDLMRFVLVLCEDSRCCGGFDMCIVRRKGFGGFVFLG